MFEIFHLMLLGACSSCCLLGEPLQCREGHCPCSHLLNGPDVDVQQYRKGGMGNCTSGGANVPAVSRCSNRIGR